MVENSYLLKILKILIFFKTTKNMRHLTAAFGTKWFSVICLVRRWIYFVLYRNYISETGFIFSWFASVTLWKIINLRNFLVSTPNVHLVGLSIILLTLRVAKVFVRSNTCCSTMVLFTSISSTYTSIVCPISYSKTFSTSLLYVVPTFLNLNGITLLQYMPCPVMKKSIFLVIMVH